MYLDKFDKEVAAAFLWGGPVSNGQSAAFYRQWRVAILPRITDLNDAKPAHAVLSSNDQITIRGARTHNLKGIDVNIPHNALTVVSGVLRLRQILPRLRHRIRRRPAALRRISLRLRRQFLERIEKPDVDHMDGLAPAIAIKQKNQTPQPRSTVATATEIYDYLRLLYARCGTVTCLHCGGIVKRDTVDEIVTALLALPEGTRTYALFPIVRAEIKLEPMQVPTPPKCRASQARKKSASKKSAKPTPSVAGLESVTEALKDRLTELRRRAYNRLYQNGTIVEFSTPESLLELDFSQPIYVLIDRLAISPEVRSRIVDAIETGYRESGEVRFHTHPRAGDPTRKSVILSEGGALAAAVEGPAVVLGAPQTLRFSAAFECTTCHRAYREPEPRLFSFNNPYGACPRCQGFGNTIDFDPTSHPRPLQDLADGAIAPGTPPNTAPPRRNDTRRQGRQHPHQRPLLRSHPRSAALHRRRRRSLPRHPRLLLRARPQKIQAPRPRLPLQIPRLRYLPRLPRPAPPRRSRAVLIQSGTGPHAGPAKNICETSALTITAAQQFFDNLQLPPSQNEIAGKVLEEVRQRITSSSRSASTTLPSTASPPPSPAASPQRIQLATSLGSRLVGALYVLDEPSIGLHTPRHRQAHPHHERPPRPRQHILVVEHDPDVIRAADHLLDLGPGAGELGGHLLAAGTVAEVTANPNSITGKYLSGRLTIPVPKHRREPGREHLKLTGARIHNLRGVDLDLPLNLLCCVTGVSGSGKSTLVHQVLYRALMQALNREPPIRPHCPAHLYRELTGTQHLNDVILVDQSPIGRTPRSNPVTYIKAFDDIRALFAAQPDAKRRGFGPGHFSFNVPGGRCDVCEGDGTVTVEMQFLADIELPCEECNGTRYKSSILEIKYRNRNIYDVLNMTVKEALVYFAGHPKIVDKLAVLDEVGLAYVRLGQSATTLSGGEAQRVKLASHLSTARSISGRSGDSASQAAAKARSRTLYILDEPTTASTSTT